MRLLVGFPVIVTFSRIVRLIIAELVGVFLIVGARIPVNACRAGLGG